MKCKEAPLLAATFFSVFFIIFFSGSKVREKNETIALTSTIEPTPEPTLETCPRPSTNIEDLKWVQMGDAIKGKVIDNYLLRQPVDISHDGHTVVLGAPWYYTGTTTVDVLNFIGGSWQEEESFSGSGWDGFGIGVRLSDGHVEVYQRKEEGGWKPKGNKILGLKAGDNFGSSVSLSQNGYQLAVGAFGSNLNGVNSGSAQVYQFQHEDWVETGQVIAGEAAGDLFGYAVSLSADGNIVAIGAPESDENGYFSGYVKVFRYYTGRRTLTTTNTIRNMQSTEEGGQWRQIGQKLLGQAEDDVFGNSLSINAKGDTIVVGTRRLGNYAKVFHFQDEQWKQLGETLTGENDFGESVSIAANAQRIAVGPRDEDEGYVRVYDFNGDDWVKVGEITASTSEKYFGDSISLSSCGDRLAVGLIYDDGTNDRHRSMKVFELFF